MDITPLLNDAIKSRGGRLIGDSGKRPFHPDILSDKFLKEAYAIVGGQSFPLAANSTASAHCAQLTVLILIV